MINLMLGRTLMKFDRQLPFYNWLYPMKGQELDTVSHDENMMYYLSPAGDQQVLDDFVALIRRTTGLTDGDTRMLPLLMAGA